MEDLTPRQAQILEIIRAHIDESGMPPTRADICRIMRFKSPNAAEEHLRTLARKGAIEMLPGMSRGLRLTDEVGLGIPVVGRVAAGAPILAEENVESRYDIDRNLFRPRAHYLLRVRGMSMRDAGILDGDLLAVNRTRDARSGQVVVARIGDEVTVKRLRRRGNHVTLMPENPDFDPIEIDAREPVFAIEGIAVGVIRNNRAF
jgi:repressor LexA